MRHHTCRLDIGFVLRQPISVAPFARQIGSSTNWSVLGDIAIRRVRRRIGTDRHIKPADRVCRQQYNIVRLRDLARFE